MSEDGEHRSIDPVEFLLGKIPEGSFEVLAAKTLKRQAEIPDSELTERARVLLDQGVSLDPTLTPTYWKPERFTAEDWERIRHSATPLLALYSANNYHGLIQRTERRVLGYNPRTDPRLGYEGQRDEAFLRSLPLIHGTSAETFAQAVETGEILTYREALRRRGYAAMTTGKYSGTTFEDRQVGLDQYVFTDFGRPHKYRRDSNQPEITLVIDPAVMDQPGVFVTELDYLDCHSHGGEDLIDLRRYLETALTPEYFYESALLYLALAQTGSGETQVSRGVYQSWSTYNDPWQFADGVDSEQGSFAAQAFSTWEVKLPRMPMAAVRRVVVRDSEVCDQLRERFGNLFEFSHEPTLKAAIPQVDPGNYANLRIPGAFEAKFHEVIELDHQRRAAKLAALPPEERETVVVLFPGAESSPADSARPIGLRTNPYRHPDQMIIYGSMDELRDDAAAECWGSRTASGKPVWFAAETEYPYREPPPTGVIASAERSKTNHELISITDFRSYEVTEFHDPEPPPARLPPAPVSPEVARRRARFQQLFEPGSPLGPQRPPGPPGQTERRPPRP